MVSDRDRTDVLVVGAGPAGAATALQLARAGFAVTIADRKVFPRPKACGEFLSPEAVPYLQALGLGDTLAELGAWPVHGMRVSAYGRSMLGRFVQLPDRGPHGRTGFGVRRERFDHRLLQAAEAAGARFLPRHEFVGLRRGEHDRVVGAALRDPDGTVRPLHARWLVGADGVHSRVARALGVQRSIPWLDQFALVAHFGGVEPLPHADVELLCGGFAAATTVDGGLCSVNLVLPARALASRGAQPWDDFVAGHLAASSAIRARLAGAPRRTPWRGTGPFGFRTTTATKPGAALAGDAAGYVDPLTGEGIYFALFGARALGDALTAALHDARGEGAAMSGYQLARARELGPRLRAASLLQRGLRHPWLVRACLRALGRWPRLADLAVTLAGDTVHPRELRRGSFWRTFASAQTAHCFSMETSSTKNTSVASGGICPWPPLP